MTIADTTPPVIETTPRNGEAGRAFSGLTCSLPVYYQDANVKLYHADCRNVLPELEMADLLLTDPPYGVNYASNMSMTGTTPITNDGARISLRLYKHVVPMLNAKHWLWFTRWDAWPDVWEILAERMPIRGLLVWEKKSIGMGDLKPRNTMNRSKWEELKGKRLLITDSMTRIARNEWTLLEISPNGNVAKFRNELADCQFWTDLDELMVMDVLPPNAPHELPPAREREPRSGTEGAIGG